MNPGTPQTPKTPSSLICAADPEACGAAGGEANPEGDGVGAGWGGGAAVLGGPPRCGESGNSEIEWEVPIWSNVQGSKPVP